MGDFPFVPHLPSSWNLFKSAKSRQNLALELEANLHIDVDDIIGYVLREDSF